MRMRCHLSAPWISLPAMAKASTRNGDAVITDPYISSIMAEGVVPPGTNDDHRPCQPPMVHSTAPFIKGIVWRRSDGTGMQRLPIPLE